MSIASLLLSVDSTKVKKIQELWDGLLQLNNIFSSGPDDLSTEMITDFKHKARDWGRLFVQVYRAADVTPYIHALMNHVHEFMNLHGSILPFTQQVLEKYNDIVTKSYFRSTNHQGEKALLQVMQRQNRMNFMSDNGVSIQKRNDITCSRCGINGHNKRTCSSQATP